MPLLDHKEKLIMRQLKRSATDNKIAGVCGGIAEYFGIDSKIVRVLFAIFALSGGSGIFLYIVLAIIMPKADATE